MKNNKQNGGPPKQLQFLGRSQNPEIFNNIKQNVPGGYPAKNVNTDDWKELKKFDNGDTLVEYNTLFNNSTSGKADIAPNWALRDATTGKYHPLDNFGDVETLKKLFDGGPVDPLKPISAPQESIGIKSIPTMGFNIDPYSGTNIIENFNAKMLENPITSAEMTAYKTFKTGDYNPGVKPITRTSKLDFEKSYGGLTKGENNLVNELQKLLDRPRNDVFEQYSLGGQILSTAAGFIPGIGGILSPTIGLIDQQMDKNKIQDQINYEKNQPQVPDVNNRIYGNTMATGGMVTNNFKQYNTGSHSSGNDQSINDGGTPSANAVASVQNKENAYINNKGEAYIHSDVLANPETGNTFNIDAAKLNKRFSNADKSMDDKNALDFGMKRLSILNDKVRNIQEMVQKACGGKVKQLSRGGGPDDPNVPPSDNIAWNGTINNQSLLDAELSIPLSDNSMWDADTNQLYDGAANPQPVYPKDQNLSILPPTTSRNDPNARNTSLPDLNSLVTPVGKPVQVGNRDAGTLGDTNYNVPAMILKGIGLAKSAADALTPAEKERAILPDYRKSDKEMYATNIDYTQAKQDALAAANLAGNVNRSASGSFEQFQGRQANNYANYADQVGNLSMREALDRNQQHVQRAGYEQGKAVDTAGRETQNRINNQENQANSNLADQKFFSELTSVGSEFNKYQYYKDMVTNKKEIAYATINEGLALIGSNNTNFGLADDFMERIKSGTATTDELVKFMTVTDKIKTESKTKTN